MLKRLIINNLAIIENINVEFREGFTVLTGGTGAGKSLVIDSLSLLLGARASSELIRQGEEKATIIGYFDIHNPRIEAVLSKLDIPFIDGELKIERVIGKNRNIIKANGVALSLQDLNKISKHLADIHSQFDFEKILNPENYLEIIDGFSYEMTSSYKKDYLDLLDVYRNKKKELQVLLDKKKKLEEARDFYEFQYKELNDAELRVGEEEEIEQELSLLKNYDKIYELSHEADSIIREDFIDRLYELNKILEKLSSVQPQYKEIHDQLDEQYYSIDDTFQTLKKNFKNIDYDPERLDVLQQRQSDLNALKRKYHKSIEELIAYRDELSMMIGKDSTFEEDIQRAKESLNEAFEKAYQKGLDLSKIRTKIAKSIEKEVENNLTSLLLKARFEVSFLPNESKDDSIFKEDGLDAVDFLIETNVGEGLKSLAKVVSGGEASRIMLAFKAIFVKANKIATVIFDEIDTGISGEAAEAVAKKIKEISYSSQVIAITHMPQIASKSDHHILISKEVKSGRTYTSVKELDLDGKIAEIAHLISGGKVTEKQLEYAKELVMSDK